MSRFISFATLLGLLTLIVGCGGDKKDRYDYAQIAGTYQITQEDLTKGPTQLTVYLVDRDTSLLVTRDASDKTSTLKGTLNESTGTVTFSDGSSCTDKAAALSCSIKGVTTDVAAITTSAAGVASLAGNYELLSSDNQLYKLTVTSDGKISSTTLCSLSGQFSQSVSPALNKIQLQDCSGKKVFGVFMQEKIDATTTALEVYLPDSTLPGFWIRQ